MGDDTTVSAWKSGLRRCGFRARGGVPAPLRWPKDSKTIPRPAASVALRSGEISLALLQIFLGGPVRHKERALARLDRPRQLYLGGRRGQVSLALDELRRIHRKERRAQPAPSRPPERRFA